MKGTVFELLFLFTLFSCTEVHQNTKESAQFFKASIYPSFIEAAEVTLFQANKEQKIEFLLREIQRDDRLSDTLYFKKVSLSNDQFNLLDSGLIQKTFTRSSDKPKGIRDGIYIDFIRVRNSDTTSLQLDNPHIGDTSAYRITKGAIDYFRLFFADSIIHDYLDDVESYIDNSKKGIQPTENRAINKLRKIEYSR